ncbi:hypothetical protein C8J56DRAFT_924488 [Mycena floridula]|nr:hypothetical protein C8J56DRAFT_972754 [Mycena floridula]KAJ7577621.1 hypothetical protein C8J56DRAFT_970324 [Mycena floridula]KAJ7596207.1 hypothetical protein C8J56DRAFT_924488 [Mycena floridula]
MPPKSSRVRVPSGQAARNNAIGDDPKLKRTRKTVAEPEASPSPESSPAKKKIRIRVVSKPVEGQGNTNTVKEKADDADQSAAAAPPANDDDSNDEGSQYCAEDVDAVAAAWADADDDVAAVVSADDAGQEEYALSSPPAARKTRSKKAKRGKKKATSLPSTDDELPPANEIPFVTSSGVQVVAKPMKYEASKATKTNKAPKRIIVDEVINLSSGEEGPDKPDTVETKIDIKHTDKGLASKIMSKIGTPTKTAGSKSTSVIETPKTPTTPKTAAKSPQLDRAALQAALASPFKPKVSAETPGISAGVKFHDEVHKYNHSFPYSPDNISAKLTVPEMARHYDPLYDDIKMAGVPVVPSNILWETYGGDYVDSSPKKIGTIFDLYGEADVTHSQAALSFVKDAMFINPSWASPLAVDLNKSGVLCRVMGSTLSSRAARFVSVGMVRRCNFVTGVAGIKDKLKHALTFAFFPLDALRVKGFLGVVTGEEQMVVQGVDIDGETYISMDTRQIDENHSKATVYKWTKTGRRVPSNKDSLDYTDIVPIFDLRNDFDVNKDMENIFKFPVWPHPEVHEGAIVLPCYTISIWIKNGRTFVAFNLLWLGVLHGDDTINV